MYCYGLQVGSTFGELMSRWRLKQKDDAPAVIDAMVVITWLRQYAWVMTNIANDLEEALSPPSRDRRKKQTNRLDKRRAARAKKLPRALGRQVAEYAASEGWKKLPPNALDKHRA